MQRIQLSKVIADWSVARDAFARARLGAMRELLRDKAGLAGEGQNLVTRTDVLDVLDLQSPDDLFPCPVSGTICHLSAGSFILSLSNFSYPERLTGARSLRLQGLNERLEVRGKLGLHGNGLSGARMNELQAGCMQRHAIDPRF